MHSGGARKKVWTGVPPAPKVWIHSTPSMMAVTPRVCQPTRYTRPFFSRLSTGQRSGHERRYRSEKRSGIRERGTRPSTGVNQQKGYRAPPPRRPAPLTVLRSPVESPLFSGQSPTHATSPLLTRFHTPGAGLLHQGSDLRALTTGHLMSPLKCPQDFQKAPGRKATSSRGGPRAPSR